VTAVPSVFPTPGGPSEHVLGSAVDEQLAAFGLPEHDPTLRLAQRRPRDVAGGGGVRFSVKARTALRPIEEGSQYEADHQGNPTAHFQLLHDAEHELVNLPPSRRVMHRSEDEGKTPDRAAASTTPPARTGCRTPRTGAFQATPRGRRGPLGDASHRLAPA